MKEIVFPLPLNIKPKLLNTILALADNCWN